MKVLVGYPSLVESNRFCSAASAHVGGVVVVVAITAVDARAERNEPLDIGGLSCALSEI